MTRFCSNCRKNGHTIMYCRTKAYDGEIKRQQTRNNQEHRTVFTHDYNKKRGRNFGSQNSQNFNQQPRYGYQNNQTPCQQTDFNPDRNRNPNSDRQLHRNRSSISWNNGQITVSRLSIKSMLDQKILIFSKTETFHRATTYLHPTQFNSSTIRDKMR